MNSDIYPRVAPRTRKRSPGPLKLPPLLVGHFDPDGELVGTSELPDPRERYCQTYNELAGVVGLTAFAIDADEVPATAKRSARKAGAQ